MGPAARDRDRNVAGSHYHKLNLLADEPPAQAGYNASKVLMADDTALRPRTKSLHLRYNVPDVDRPAPGEVGTHRKVVRSASINGMGRHFGRKNLQMV